MAKFQPPATPIATGIKIEMVPLDTLHPHPKNPRKHNEKNLLGIIASIKRARMLAPLVVWGKQNWVIVGNGRLEALRRMGAAQVPVVRCDYLSESEAEIHMIEDNKLTELSTWDAGLLGELMGGLAAQGVDLTSTGFDPAEIEPLLCPMETPPPPEVGEVNSEGPAEPEEITCPHCGGAILIGGE